MSPFKTQKLDTRKHQRESFECSNSLYSIFLKQYANQQQKRGECNVYVFLESDGTSIIGYYTLTPTTLEITDLPIKLNKQYGRNTLGCTLLGMLAVHRDYEGKGLGRILIFDAMKRVISQTEVGASSAHLVLDADNPELVAWYEKLGFVPTTSNPMRLYMPFAKIEAVLKAAGLL